MVIGGNHIGPLQHTQHPGFLQGFHDRDLVNTLDIKKLHGIIEIILRRKHDHIPGADGANQETDPLLLIVQDILHVN